MEENYRCPNCDHYRFMESFHQLTCTKCGHVINRADIHHGNIIKSITPGTAPCSELGKSLANPCLPDGWRANHVSRAFVSMGVKPSGRVTWTLKNGSTSSANSYDLDAWEKLVEYFIIREPLSTEHPFSPPPRLLGEIPSETQEHTITPTHSVGEALEIIEELSQHSSKFINLDLSALLQRLEEILLEFHEDISPSPSSLEQDRYEKPTEVPEEIRQLAEEHNIPIVVLSQTESGFLIIDAHDMITQTSKDTMIRAVYCIQQIEKLIFAARTLNKEWGEEWEDMAFEILDDLWPQLTKKEREEHNSIKTPTRRHD